MNNHQRFAGGYYFKIKYTIIKKINISLATLKYFL